MSERAWETEDILRERWATRDPLKSIEDKIDIIEHQLTVLEERLEPLIAYAEQLLAQQKKISKWLPRNKT